MDTALDLAFIAYDLYRIGADNVFGDCDNLDENFTALGLDAGAALVPFATGAGMVSRVARTSKAVKPVWPATAGEMGQIVGFVGRRIPDTVATPGRGKVVWEPAQGVKITYEQHPYHPTAPEWHRNPHWHLDTPGAQHQRYLPGDPIPGY